MRFFVLSRALVTAVLRFCGQRMSSMLRAGQKPADDHAHVYWADEDCVRVVALSKFAEPPVVGEACQVHIGKKSYEGTIIKIGTFLYP